MYQILIYEIVFDAIDNNMMENNIGKVIQFGSLAGYLFFFGRIFDEPSA